MGAWHGGVWSAGGLLGGWVLVVFCISSLACARRDRLFWREFCSAAFLPECIRWRGSFGVRSVLTPRDFLGRVRRGRFRETGAEVTVWPPGPAGRSWEGCDQLRAAAFRRQLFLGVWDGSERIDFQTLVVSFENVRDLSSGAKPVPQDSG